MLLRAQQCLLGLLGLLAILTLANPVEKHVPARLNDTVHTAASWDWSNCGTSIDLLQIKSIKVAPDPPQPGKNLTVSVVANVVSSIDHEDGAYVNVSVRLGMATLLRKTLDFCKELQKLDAGRCPLKPGSFTAHHTAVLPREIPPGKFVIRAEGYDVHDDNLFCVTIKVDFGARS